MPRFVTETGSAYEVDYAGCRVRRLGGINEPTPRQGKDGEWREYAHMTPLAVGHPVLFTWRFDFEPEGVWARATTTSRVTKIVDAECEDDTSKELRN